MCLCVHDHFGACQNAVLPTKWLNFDARTGTRWRGVVTILLIFKHVLGLTWIKPIRVPFPKNAGTGAKVKFLLCSGGTCLVRGTFASVFSTSQCFFISTKQCDGKLKAFELIYKVYFSPYNFLSCKICVDENYIPLYIAYFCRALKMSWSVVSLDTRGKKNSSGEHDIHRGFAVILSSYMQCENKLWHYSAYVSVTLSGTAASLAITFEIQGYEQFTPTPTYYYDRHH